MDGQYRPPEIIRLAQHPSELEALESLHQAIHQAFELLCDRLVRLVEQLGHFVGVAQLAFEGVVSLDPLLMLLYLGENGAGPLVVVPEVGRRARGLEDGYALAPGSEVKDSSRGGPTSPPGRSAGACIRVRRS
jgi:hypothetical protein